VTEAVMRLRRGLLQADERHTMEEKNQIGARIKQFRLSKGLTLKDIELKANVSATHVSEIERGMTSPTVGALAKIAHAMGTDVAYFVEKKNVSMTTVVHKPFLFPSADWQI